MKRKKKNSRAQISILQCLRAPLFSSNSLQIRTFNFLTLDVNLQENVTEHLPMPALFQFLTLLAFKIFIDEEVNHFSFS